MMGIRERAAARRSKIIAHRTSDFREAEEWDLDFWQSQSAEQRLSARALRQVDSAFQQAHPGTDYYARAYLDAYSGFFYD